MTPDESASPFASVVTDVTTAAAVGALELVGVAEEEIAAAQHRHPTAVADTIWHSFALLNAGDLRDDRLRTEMVYRAHCRELLNRIATGADPRPGTAAEVCCVLLAASKIAPLNSHHMGLYMRVWVAADLPDIADIAETSKSYEAIYAGRIDDEESEVRRRLTDPKRTLGDIHCCGLHHGESVNCRYAVAAAAVVSDSAVTRDHTYTTPAVHGIAVSPWIQPPLFGT